MAENTLERFKQSMVQLAEADGTVAEARAHEILTTELAHEVLETVVGGLAGCGGHTWQKQRHEATTPSANYDPGRTGGLYGPFGRTVP